MKNATALGTSFRNRPPRRVAGLAAGGEQQFLGTVAVAEAIEALQVRLCGGSGTLREA